MLTKELINQRIDLYRKEMAILQSKHDEMVKVFQTNISANQTRYAQITGAIAELKEILKHELPSSDSNDWKPDPSTDRVSDPDHRAGHHLGTPVVHRELDLPHPAPGEAGAGHHSPDTGHPVGRGIANRN